MGGTTGGVGESSPPHDFSSDQKKKGEGGKKKKEEEERRGWEKRGSGACNYIHVHVVLLFLHLKGPNKFEHVSSCPSYQNTLALPPLCI